MKVYASVKMGCAQGKEHCDDRALVGDVILDSNSNSHKPDDDENNVDSGIYEFDIDVSDTGKTFAVADGVGGTENGWFAAQFGLTGIQMELNNNDILDDGYIRNSIATINNTLNLTIKENIQIGDSASTLSLVKIFKDKIVYAQLGDSRIYLLTNSEGITVINRITTDQNNMRDWVSQGLYAGMDEEDIIKIPGAAHITGYLGAQPDRLEEMLEVGEINYHDGDVLIITSDGIHDYMKPTKMRKILASDMTPVEKIKALTEEALREGDEKNSSKDDQSIVYIELSNLRN